MKIEVKATSDGVGYANKEPYEWDGRHFDADIMNGDVVTIRDEGTIETGGKFGDQHYFKIETRNGVKKAPFNQSSLNILAQEWGDESREWVGKRVNVITQKAIVAGERRIKVYYVTDGWHLDEWGDLVKNLPVDRVVEPLPPEYPPQQQDYPPISSRDYPEFSGPPTI